jgi:hypothetical protein
MFWSVLLMLITKHSFSHLKLKNKAVYCRTLYRKYTPMKNLLAALLGIAAVISLNSCSVERDYVFNAADKVCSPGLRERGELYIDGSRKLKSTGPSGTSSSWSGDIAYGVHKHLGLMASVRTLNEHIESTPKSLSSNMETRVFNLTGTRAEAAIGYFTGFGAHGKLETYFGVGGGEIDNTGSYPGNYSASHMRVFGQFGAGYDHNIVSFMGGLKLTGHSTTVDVRKIDNVLFNELIHNPGMFHVLLLDPYAEAQVGYKQIKLSVQIGCDNVIPYDMNPAEQNRYYLSGFYCTVGVAVRFAHRYTLKRVWGAKKWWENP